MIKHQPEEILGEMINHWDDFYANNYSWLLKSLLEINNSEIEAKKQIEKAFIKLCLTHPQIVINGTQESIQIELGQMIPDLGKWIQTKSLISTRDLMKTYYNPN